MSGGMRRKGLQEGEAVSLSRAVNT